VDRTVDIFRVYPRRGRRVSVSSRLVVRINFSLRPKLRDRVYRNRREIPIDKMLPVISDDRLIGNAAVPSRSDRQRVKSRTGNRSVSCTDADLEDSSIARRDVYRCIDTAA